MRTRLIAAVALPLALFACSKNDSKSVTADSDAATTQSKKFTPEPLGTIPPSDPEAPDEPEEPAAAAEPSATGSAKGAASAAPAAGKGATSTASVKLLDPGAEPRTKLRYKVQLGHVETTQIDLQVTTTADMAGQQQTQKQPPVRIVLALEPKTVSPDGDVRYEYRIVSADIPDASSAQALAAKPSFDALKGMSGWAVITSRGITKDAAFPAPAGTSEQVAQTLDQIKQTARELATPFPEEAVGKGAKWEKTTQVNAGPAHATQKETYTLVEVNGDTGKLQVATTLTAPSASAPGEPVRMEGLSSIGKGQAAYALNRIAAQSTLDATTTLFLVGPDESGAQQKLKMITRGLVKVAPVAAASSAAPK